MTPEEKAKDLIDKFRPYADRGMEDSEFNETKSAIECALIAVDEIINVLDDISIGESGTTKMDFGQSFFESVKQSIINTK